MFTSTIIDEIINPIVTKEDPETNFKYVLDIIRQLTINHQILEVVSIRIMNKDNFTVDSLQVVVEFFISLFNKVETIQPF